MMFQQGLDTVCNPSSTGLSIAIPTVNCNYLLSITYEKNTNISSKTKGFDTAHGYCSHDTIYRIQHGIGCESIPEYLKANRKLLD
jgi:hypothetical protein